MGTDGRCDHHYVYGYDPTMNREMNICAVIPTYNNAGTIGDVVRRVSAQLAHVIVVVDGSTDQTREVLSGLDVPFTLVDLPQNGGKGAALKQGFRAARELGFTHVLTIDADGQHLPEDIPLLVTASRAHPDAIIVGCRGLKQDNMPAKNTFANRFSNFWFAVQTAQYLPDTQSGYRIYPLEKIRGERLMTARYESELTLLVFSAWAGVQIVPIGVRVYYPPKEERVSHFRPAYDFTRISILNTCLCVLALVYGLPRRGLHALRQAVSRNGRTAMTMLMLSLLPTLVHCAERITAYLAPDSLNTGTAVIVCPGGSYSWLDLRTEGEEVAKWLQQHGINAYVLRYRVAGVGAYIIGYRVLGVGHRYPDMLTDVEDALRYVYEHAEADHVDTNRIGVMGFSAGGHLAMSAYAYNRTAFRPKFVCPIYPVVTMSDERYVHGRSRRGALGVWGQWNKHMQDSLSIEKHIRPDCPPVFLVNCTDDPVVKHENSALLDSALTANHVPHSYIWYATGGHGFGASDSKGTEESQQWKQAFLLWISNISQEKK